MRTAQLAAILALMTTRSMVYLGRDRVQIGSWKSRSDIANLIPFPAAESLPTEAVRKTIVEAQSRGYGAAFTAALTPQQAEPFFAAGFELHEELHLLRRPLTAATEVDRAQTRRARRADWDDVLALDSLAFEQFWQFDRTALTEAIRATPRHRFQVIRSTPVHGYHVTGLAGSNAYVQRVAVHPDAHRRGYGTALVNDSLHWAWRCGATLSQVNTQITNEAAVALYERCGFTLAPFRLQVLHRAFTDAGEQPRF